MGWASEPVHGLLGLARFRFGVFGGRVQRRREE